MSGTDNTESTESQVAGTPQNDARDVWVKRVLGIETAGGYRSTPLKTKALPDKYDGEDTSLGFRAEMLSPESMAQTAAVLSEQMSRKAGRPVVATPEQVRASIAKNAKFQVTRYHTPEQQAATEISFDETGRAYNQSGKAPLQTGKLLQTLSPEGKLHATPHSHVVRMPDGSERPHRAGVPIPAGGQLVATHHSTLLAGGDVAGAGHVYVDNEHITQVDDQSGHYKPDAEMTHQAVAELAAQGGLVDRRVINTAQAPIDAASFGRISPELGARAQAQDALMARINAPQPGDDVAALTQQHRRESALMHAAAQKAIEGLSAKDREKAGLQGIGSGNREARVDLMDKRSGITDEEFAALRSLPVDEREAATKDRAKLNQLKAPLGEAAFAKLQAAATAIRVMQAALDAGGEKLATAMKKAGVDTPEAFTEKMNAVRERLGADSIADLQQKRGVGDIAGLKVKLGEDAVAAIANDDTAKQQLYAAHGVKDIAMTDVNSQAGVNLEIGAGNAINLATSQFLQTGGNETQARNKRALHGELAAEVARREAMREEQKRIRRMANDGVIAAGGVVPPRAAPPNALDGDDQIDPEGALHDGFDGDDGGPPVQDYDDLRDMADAGDGGPPVQDYDDLAGAGDAEAADIEEQEQTAAPADNDTDFGSTLRDGFDADDERRSSQRRNDDDDLLG
jgi:hypothetical protein